MDNLFSENKDKAFYTFDIGVLKDRIAYLKEHLPENVTLCYAVKANPFIVKAMDDVIEKFEICSPGENAICSSYGVESRKKVISGIYKSDSDIKDTLSKKSFKGIITVESLSQYESICDCASDSNNTVKILLRLTNDSQFGINKEDIFNIIKQNDNPLVSVEGIQYFSGTQKTSLKKLSREINMLDELLNQLKDELSFETHELEYGPGFPVSYYIDDDFDEVDYLKSFGNLLSCMHYKVHVTLELGRSIAASCGKYYTHIADIKRNRNHNYIIVDGGMHHIVYFGQQMAMKQPFTEVYPKKPKGVPETYTICGSLCSMNDILVKQAELLSPEKGDVICFENAGAYCMTEGMSLFLSRDIPAVYLIDENKVYHIARPRFETRILNKSDC